MAGTILHRILSKTKPAPAQTRLETTTAEISLDMAGTKTTSPRLSFEKPSGSRKSSLGQHKIPSMHNSRKHSYASVREEADLPQSFRTRRLSTDSELPNDRLPKPPLLSTKPEDEEAILDDASDVTPAASYDGADSFEEETLVRKPITLDSLPDEILDEIFCRIQLDTSQPLTDWLPRSDLFSCLSVSKSLHAAALRMLYKHVLICRSKTFWKMASNLQEDVELGSLIQTLDFSHYSHMGTGRSRSQTSETLYLTKDNLRAVLSHTRKLRNFLVHEHLDTELDAGVLSTLFSIPTLRAVDFTSCSHRTFLDAFSSLWLDSAPADYAQIRRLCLHECGTLKPQVFEAMLPRLDNLTHLDVAHTQIDDKALLSISKNARITHLNLERCTQLTGDAVVQFLTEHPAAKNTMIWLNLNADPSRHRLLSAENLHDLLPALPDTLRSLNIGGAKIVSEHVPALRQLACQLEELGIKGADLSLTEDIISILSVQPKKLDNLKSNLRYLDLTNIGSVTQMSLCYSPTSIIDSSSLPLEAIELGATVLTEIAKRQKNVRNPEWTVKELSRRGWYVRNPIPGTKRDDGYRSWKMGAHWWGMRKLPMVEQEVGGMYGYFMFKKN